MSLDFEKYVAKGFIGDLSAVALYTSGGNGKIKSGISSPGHLESKTVQSASIMRMTTFCGYLVQRRDLVQCRKTMHKELENINRPLRGFMRRFYVSSPEEFSFCRKRHYSCIETDALKV